MAIVSVPVCVTKSLQNKGGEHQALPEKYG